MNDSTSVTDSCSINDSQNTSLTTAPHGNSVVHCINVEHGSVDLGTTISDILPQNDSDEYGKSSMSYINSDENVIYDHQDSVHCKHTNNQNFKMCKYCMSAHKYLSSTLAKSNGLKIGQLNVRSILPKIEEIRYLLSNSGLDILCINESWLDNTICNSEINVDNYVTVRNDRNRSGGGVLIYIKENLDYKERADLCVETIEATWIELKLTSNTSMLLCCLYRPPSAKNEYFNDMLDMFEKAYVENSELCLAGDLNHNYVFDESLSTNPIHYIENLYMLKQIVTEPTRVTMTSSTLLDVILTSIPDKHVMTGIAKICLSDHYLVFTCLNVKTKVLGHKTVKYRDYSGFVTEKYINSLKESEVFTSIQSKCSDVIDDWRKWKDEFDRISEKNAPIKCVRVKKRYNPWITSDIIKLMYERDYIHLKATQSEIKNLTLWGRYKQLRNKINSMVNQAKKDYFSNLVNESKGNSKKMWKEVNKIVNDEQGNNKIPPDMTADAFNSYYVQIGKQIAQQSDSDSSLWKNPNCLYTFKFRKISVKDVYDQLVKLDSDSSLDILNMDCKLLKLGAEILAPSITSLFNSSVETGRIPNDWKYARVTPIYKGKGDKNMHGNYRPISVLCHISKILEREIQTQLMEYLTDHALVNIDQFAFLKSHSTQTCLHRLVDDWLEAMDDDEIIGACFLDIQKCFDTINHKLLLQKLAYYGINDNELQWFTNYLHERQQSVFCNGMLSKPEQIDIGVPQGSILGPILFLLYVNDLSQHIPNGSCNMYADDVAVYLSGTDIVDVKNSLQDCIDGAVAWHDANKLKVNVGKSNVMLIGSKNKICNDDGDRFQIVIDDEQLERVRSTRYLGVILDDLLNWNNQTHSVSASISYKLSILSRFSKTAPSSLLDIVYKTCIQPTIDYGCTIWGNCSNSNKT